LLLYKRFKFPGADGIAIRFHPKCSFSWNETTILITNGYETPEGSFDDEEQKLRAKAEEQGFEPVRVTHDRLAVQNNIFTFPADNVIVCIQLDGSADSTFWYGFFFMSSHSLLGAFTSPPLPQFPMRLFMS
jgi:hypothetical protein